MRAGFAGGLRLAGQRQASAGGPIRACPLPEELVLPLQQHAGEPARPRIAPGARVRRGECLADAPAGLGAALHAPASGVLHRIEPRRSAEDPGMAVECLVLRPDGARDEAFEAPWADWELRSAAELRERIASAGIVGLGGAGFPTAAKLAPPIDRLVLNGIECEPWIACDDALLRERADEVVHGGRVLRRAVGAQRLQLALEDDMPEAIAAARAAIAAHGAGEVELVVLPARYPQGGERQLVQSLTGAEVPRAQRPPALGVLVQNVATAAACWHAVAAGRPLLQRIVSVTGPGVARPGNYEVALGTPIAHLVAQAGGYTAAAARLLLGGPMMGIALPDDDFPVLKATQCVLVLDAPPAVSAPVLPCIRCGECARACPARLLPQQLHWFAGADQPERLRQHGLFDCIECGACDLVCPSQLPLVQQFREAKQAMRASEAAVEAADAARARHAARAERLERDAREAAQAQAARAAASSPDAVQAALARARARRRDGAPP